MIGELDEPMRVGLTGLLEATVGGDARAATDAYLDLGIVGPDIDRYALERDLAELLREVRQRPVAEVSVGDALQRLVRIGGRHRVRNPGAILLLTRAFLIVEGVLRQLDPRLNVVAVFGEEVGAVTADRYSTARLAERAKRSLRELDLLVANAPNDLRRLLRRAGEGDLGRVYAPGVGAWPSA
jgi:ubiquinone biosynthesis protein